MKNIKLRLLATLFCVILCVGCSFDNLSLPESVAVKTKAKYNYTIGSFERYLSEDFSRQTLEDLLVSDDEDSETHRFKIYDYNPGGNYKTLAYLVDYPVRNLPLDFGSYLEKIDFATKLQNKSIEQVINVPEVKIDDERHTVDFPNISEILCEKSDFAPVSFAIPLGVNGSIPTAQDPSFPVNVVAPTFTSFDFSSGNLILSLETPDTIPQGYRTNLTLSLYKQDGTTLITSKSGINLATTTQVLLPLTNKSVSQNMLVKVTGTVNGGVSGNTLNYTVRPSLQTGTTLKKATGLTMDLGSDGVVAINERFAIDLPASVVSCVIGDKSTTSRSKVQIISNRFPSTWSGVTYTKQIDLAGAITAADADFDKTNETAGVLLDRTLLLSGRSLERGNLQIAGNITFAVNNATITTTNGTIDPINIDIKTTVNAMSEVTIDMTSGNSDFKRTEAIQEPFPPDMIDFITGVQLKPSGVDIKYINSLPPGNDITVTTNSDFFHIVNWNTRMQGYGESGTAEETDEVRGNKETNDTLGANLFRGAPQYPINSSAKIDLSMDIDLPGTDPNPNYATFKDLEMGKTYTLKITIMPVFDWEYIVMNDTNGNTTLGSTDRDPLDTGLNFGNMFSSLEDRLGDESFVNQINIQHIPMYLYAVIPDVTAKESTPFKISEHLKIKGVCQVGLYNNAALCGDAITVVGEDATGGTVNSEEVSLLSKLPHLKFNTQDSNMVINDISQDKDSKTNDLIEEAADLKNLFNQHQDGTVQITYNFSLTGDDKTTSGFKIYKEDIDELRDDEDETISINVHIRFLLPMNLEVTAPPDNPTSNEGIAIDLSNLIFDEPDDDMLGRDEATDIDDFEKFLDVATRVGGRYEITNKFFIYETNTNAKVTLQADKTAFPNLFDNADSKIEVPFNDSGDVILSIKDAKSIFTGYPFHPALTVALPKGKAYIPREAFMNVRFNLWADTGGQVVLF